MTLLKRLRDTCPSELFWLLVCIALLPISFALEAMTLGMRFFWFFVRFLLLVGAVHQLCSVWIALRQSRIAKWIRTAIRVGALVWLASFLIMLGVIIVGGQPDDGAEEAPFIIVLGAGLNGTEPSLVLQQRLEKAIETAEKNPDAKLILCGGQGVNSEITEAEAMRRYLVKRGMDPARLILEDTSHDTAENIANAAKLMAPYTNGETPRACLVTCSFHMMRSKLLAERCGIAAYAVPSPTRPQEFHYYLREYFSMLIYLIELTGLKIDTHWLNL